MQALCLSAQGISISSIDSVMYAGVNEADVYTYLVINTGAVINGNVSEGDSILSLSYKEKETQKALDYAKAALKIQKKAYGVKSDNYITTLKMLSLCYLRIKDNINFVITLEKIRDACKQLYGINSAEYGDLLIYLCKFYPVVNMNEEAIVCGRQAMELFYNVREKSCYKYDMAVSNLIDIFERHKDYESIITLTKKQLDRNKEIYGADSREYAFTLEMLASYIRLSGKYDESKGFAIQALKIKEKLVEVESPIYIKEKYDIARSYADYEEYQDAIRVV